MLKNLVISLVSLLLSLFLADLVLHRYALGSAYLRSWQAWVPYDTRDRLQFVLDNRKEGHETYPAPNALLFIKEPVRVGGERVVPLGGVAHALAVGGNEGGFHSTFTTDEAGFNNPRGTWPLKDRPHVFLVGDSFTYGDCVRQGEDVGSHLRGQVNDVVNLGARGNGPLQELAAIREYVPAGKVSQVFWMFYERNDLIDLRDGRHDPILMGYLDAAFSQNLLARQQEINAAVRNYIEARIEKEKAERPLVFPALRSRIKELMPRRAANDAAAEGGEGGAKPAQNEVDIELFKRVVAQARREVESKGGRFAFVYLPSYRRFSGEPLNPWANHKEAVIGAVRELGATIVDLEPHFRKTADPLSYFPFGLNGHYNGEGYALVARVLADHVDRGVQEGGSPERPS